MDPNQESYSDDELRLEDITRRSACDRCRTMKTRCERSHNRGITQLAQCRRCMQVQAKCITTLEAQPPREHQGDKGKHKCRKRPRTSSFELYTGELGLETNHGKHDQQQQTRLKEYEPGGMVSGISTSPSIPLNGQHMDELAGSRHMFDQWQELNEMVYLDSNPTQDMGTDAPGISRIPPSGNIAIPTPDHDSESLGFIDKVPTSNSLQSVAELPQGMRSPKSGPIYRDSLPPSFLFLSDIRAPPEWEYGRSIIDQLMEFNAIVTQDLQRAKDIRQEPNGDKSELGSVLVKTLQHSNLFLELIGRITGSRETTGSKLQVSERSTGQAAGASDGAHKVDTDVALQVLSCHMTVGRLFEILCSEMTTLSLRNGKVPVLPELGLDGMHNMDFEMRVSLLAHICALMYLKIQKELGQMRQHQVLTQTAETTFQAVLGGGGQRSTQIVDNLRHLMMTMGFSSS
ncbi:hypothetical protein F4861DRAFT_80756 [Xylaria intraflava]|nr:hypothetical protein F4861DRAFT_80756 [Xylaria intraflava]